MVFLKIFQNSQKNTCVGVSFFNKVAVLRPATLLKKRLRHSCFPKNFAKLLRTPFYRTPSGDYCPSQSMLKVREQDLFF